ncbi:hypothetical protein ABL78_1333 [Leptomonas seymouri]|uniref:Uncharacterized protein n=1 Tax=Leptomonas seymouri TaxID=5684 RepID=A0A0N1I0U2_LEPSE|nr:hypothetical protein ABL78_1333 [Leptomonas seymouri]|eukprot:KPI89565.1 hypothetical protein ABL78_1333 [Leptomonas seymouri]
MRPTQKLGRALPVASATAEGRRAVAELTVYLRAMKAAQRRWAREVLAHERHVRRLMLEEEQCRVKLEQQVLRGTREHLKYLVNTDLMTVSQQVSSPSVDVFLAYGVPAEQISGFSVYAMGCIAADANRLSVPLPMLLADLSSAWAILPPTKKDAFNELADIFRMHVPPRAKRPEETRLKTSTSAKARSTSVTRRGRAGAQASDSTRRLKSVKSVLPAAPSRAACLKTAGSALPDAVVPARQRLHARASKKNAPRSRGLPKTVTPLATNGPREEHRNPDAFAEASNISRGTPRKQRHQRQQRGKQSPQQLHKRHVVQMEAGTMEDFARQLPEAEYDAFCNFAQESLREMELALGASIIPVSSSGNTRKGALQSLAMRGGQRKCGSGGAVAVAAHSRSLPRAVRLFMKEWLPIAAEEWIRKTRRQKSLYMTKP